MWRQEQFEVTSTGFATWLSLAVCFGLSSLLYFFHGTVLCLSGFNSGQRGNAFSFFALDIALPLLLFVLKHFASLE